MIVDEKLCDRAILSQSPNNVEKGCRELRTITAKLIWKDRFLQATCITSCYLGALAIAPAILEIIKGIDITTPTLNSLISWASFLTGGVLLIAGTKGRKAFQTRKSFFTFGRSYDAEISPDIEDLLDELINSKLDAFEDAPDGTKTPTAKRLMSGRWVAPQIPSELFRNRFAPLLLSDDINAYEHVWRPWRQTIRHALYVVPGPNQIDETGKY